MAAPATTAAAPSSSHEQQQQPHNQQQQRPARAGEEARLLGALQALDDALAAQASLAAALKAGHLNLARGRYALHAGALGPQCYPGSMRASSRVALLPPPPARGGGVRGDDGADAGDEGDSDDGGLYEGFELVVRPPQQQQQQAAKADAPSSGGGQGEQGEAGASGSGSGADAGGGDTSQAQPQQPPLRRRSSASADPIAWFCALPPPPLKQAQRDFQGALARAVAAANAMQRLRAAVAAFEDGGHPPRSDAASADGSA